ncbi:MAG: 3'-5' exonuclease [Planctomycetota bacterium]|nr:3'-5' exonuclease [Planctomycetota bacterium]
MPETPYMSDAREGLLEDLNPAQREAVTWPGGPLLVVAGAGTGKTRVLTRRVAWLVSGGLPAASVLAITFTNKAAQVLRQRLGSLPRGEQVWAGTFHSFGAWLLRRYGDEIEVDPRFTILDRDDQRRLLRTIINDLDLKDLGFRPAVTGEAIGHVKNGSLGFASRELVELVEEPRFEDLWAEYHTRMKRASLLDFDDLLLESRRVLAESTYAGDSVRARFAHVLVDEYQDTNRVQRDLLLELTRDRDNVTVVGDPDQSIYRWRGAAVENILEFEKDFPTAHTVLLEQNYRSTKRILHAAEAVIEQNTRRHAKRLFSEKLEGHPLVEMRCRDAEGESAAVAARIQAWRREGYSHSDIAIFYRVNSMSRGIELALKQQAIPYVVVAGVEFFQRREVKDVLAYLRLVLNPRDDSAFLRVCNTPRRGVGDTSLKRLRAAASAQGLALLEMARRPDNGVSGRAKKGLAAFVQVIDTLNQDSEAPVSMLIDTAARESGYLAMLEEHPDDLERSRVDNVHELIAFAKELERDDPETDLLAFLERTALVADQDGFDEESGRVSLMSVHAAKGLEFPCVIVAGAELGLFPHDRSLDDDDGLEEERRLFYVALTRAMERLAVSHAARRITYMGSEPRRPSPFLRNVPPEVVEVDDRTGGWSYGGGGGSAYGRDDSGFFAESATYDDPGEVVREAESTLAVGARVRHPHFGEGVLRDASGRGADARVTVDFDAFGRKQMLLRYARLERVT